MKKLSELLDKLQNILKGEPVLVIGNGAAVVIYLVANTVGAVPDVTFAQATVNAAAGIAALNGVLALIRQYVTPAYKIGPSTTVETEV